MPKWIFQQKTSGDQQGERYICVQDGEHFSFLLQKKITEWSVHLVIVHTFTQMHLTTSVVIIKSLTFFQWPPLIIPFNSDSLFDGKKLPRSDPRFITLKNGLKFFLTEHFFPILLFLFVCLFSQYVW